VHLLTKRLFHRTASPHVEGKTLVWARGQMRDALVAEALQHPHLPTRLALLREIVPASIERDVQVGEELDRELHMKGWLAGSLLDSVPPQLRPTSHNAATRMLQFAVGAFPGPINQLIQVLDGELAPTTLAAQLSDATVAGTATASSTISAVEAALVALRQAYQQLHPTVQAHVLQHAVVYAITSLPKLALVTPPGTATPKQLYEAAVDRARCFVFGTKNLCSRSGIGMQVRTRAGENQGRCEPGQVRTKIGRMCTSGVSFFTNCSHHKLCHNTEGFVGTLARRRSDLC
jgi:hypothetical protein